MPHIRVTSPYTASNPLGELIVSSNGGNKTLNIAGNAGAATATPMCAIALNNGDTVTGFTGTLSVNTTPNPSTV